MTVQTHIVTNALGLHARAAARFVHAANRFTSQIRVGCRGREMDGKSIMGLLLLGAAQGTAITLTVDGADEQQAVEVLSALVARGFDEVPCA
jgi:phosphocarrier protein HPr